MYITPFSNRQALVDLSRIRPQVWEDPLIHKHRVRQELKEAGISLFAELQPESSYLPRVIHPQEHIQGAVFGRSQVGLVMLVATDRRIIFLDKKPLFVTEDEINYDEVSGVSQGSTILGTTVILHTRLGDYTIRTRNQTSARRFVNFIEDRCLESELK